jgi:hypothetical protein
VEKKFVCVSFIRRGEERRGEERREEKRREEKRREEKRREEKRREEKRREESFVSAKTGTSLHSYIVIQKNCGDNQACISLLDQINLASTQFKYNVIKIHCAPADYST